MGSPVWSPSTSNNNNFYSSDFTGAFGDFDIISQDILIEIFLFLKVNIHSFNQLSNKIAAKGMYGSTSCLQGY